MSKPFLIIVNPVTAQAIAADINVRNYIKRSPSALAEVKGDAPNENAIWGLTRTLGGIRLVIDDAVADDRNGKGIHYVMPAGIAHIVKMNENHSSCDMTTLSSIEEIVSGIVDIIGPIEPELPVNLDAWLDRQQGR